MRVGPDAGQGEDGLGGTARQGRLGGPPIRPQVLLP